MWKKYKGLFILLGIALGLAVWILVVENSRLPETSKRNVFERPREFFAGIEKVGVKAENMTVTLEKDEKKENWFMRSPVDFPADRTAVENIVDQLDLATAERTIYDVTEKLIREHGLSSPRFVITLDGGDSGTEEIRIGNNTSEKSKNIYVMVSGREEIYVIPDKVISYLFDDSSKYRSRKTIDFFATSTARLELKGLWNYVLDHTRQYWSVDSPFKATAGTLECEELSTSIYGIRIKKFVDDKPSDFAIYGLKEPAGTIMAVNDEGETVTLLIGSAAEIEEDGKKINVRYAKMENRNNVFAVLDADVEKIAKDPLTLVDTSMPKLDSASFRGLSLSNGAEKFEIFMEESEMFFRTEEGKGEPVDGTSTSELVDNIKEISGTAAVLISDLKDDKKFRGTFVLEINPEEEGSASNLRLEIGAYDKESSSYYVRRNEEDIALLVNENKLKNILGISRYSFYERQLILFDSSNVNYVSIMQEGKNIVVSKTGDTWICDSDTKKPVAAETLKSALIKWSNFQAIATTKFEKDSAALGTDSPRSKLVISYEKKADDKTVKETITFVFGKDYENGDEKGVYCWIEGKEVVYVVPNSIYQLLTEKFLEEPATPVVEGQGSPAKK